MGLALFLFADLVVLLYSCPTAKRLLELRHGADGLVHNYQLHRLGIHSSGEKLTRHCYDRIFLRRGFEALDLLLSHLVAGSDTDNITLIFFHEIRVFVT